MDRQPVDRPAGEREFELAADMMHTGALAVDQRAFNEAQRFNRNERSASTRAQDRQQNAPVTTDVEKWKAAPGKYDFPGVDTTFGVTPDKEKQRKAQDYHNDRPARERKPDMRRRGPITTDLATWKRKPGMYDFPGVDTPSRGGDDGAEPALLEGLGGLGDGGDGGRSPLDVSIAPADVGLDEIR